MKAIILAAGRGSRLRRFRNDSPKCLLDIEGQSLLEIQINILQACGIREIAVVRGYRAEKINIPGLKYYDNPRYRETGVLHSLFCAEEFLSGEVVVLYSDILFEKQVLDRILESKHNIAIGVMVDWKEAHRQRSNIGLQDLEMVYFDAESKVEKIGKKPFDPKNPQGQFIGILKLSAKGMEFLKENYRRALTIYQRRSLKKGFSIQKAWLTDLIQEMVVLGVPAYSVIIEKGWLEIDTDDDYKRALTDHSFVRRLIRMRTDWAKRSAVYNKLDWVNRQTLLSAFCDMVRGDINDRKILDLGTGTGKVLLALKERYALGMYYGVDISKDMLKKIPKRHGFKLHRAAIEDLELFNRGMFDLVTARMVFHHSIDLPRAVSETYGVLKKGGQFIICEGNPPDRSCLDFYQEMFRFKEERHSFLESDLINLLVEGGFGDILLKTVILREVSLLNWLKNSDLPLRNIQIIQEMHRNAPDFVKSAYNMKMRSNGDVLMDWKFSVVSAMKS